MNKKKIISFIMFIPFAIAIGAFILYFKYLFTIKSSTSLKVTSLIEASLVRYRNIGILCLAIGVFLLFLKTLYDYLKLPKEVVVNDERILDKISVSNNVETTNYTFNENNIVNDLLSDKTLIVRFFDSFLEDRIVKFKSYDKDNNIIEFYDLTKDKKNEPIKEEYTYTKVESYDKGSNRFSFIRFVINMIIILLCIILLLLCLNKINKQSDLNRNNLNINYIEEKTLEFK